MRFPALLLRCLLALALVTGGVPTFGMAEAATPHDPSPAVGNCHDLAEAEPAAANQVAASDADCCGSADCLCDCLQHMPAAALALTSLATPVFPAQAPAPPALQRSSPMSSSTLRPPIS